MKKFIITAASAAMLFAVPLAASADPGTETKTVTVQPTYEEITPSFSFARCTFHCH
ncbi:hypothetical protein [Paenibacillus glycanilyticus]|uniref:hypothetical protein n=1 Tax=Paenibacillus glycanilyticus TaxID=126569 RepID=UPI003EBFAD2D